MWLVEPSARDQTQLELSRYYPYLAYGNLVNLPPVPTPTELTGTGNGCERRKVWGRESVKGRKV